MSLHNPLRLWLLLASLAIFIPAPSALAQCQITEVPAIAQPQIPNKTFNVMDFGAVADGQTLNTAAFQKAIDTVGKAGGGKLIVPPGTYILAPITLVSNLDLEVQKGAIIRFTNDWKLFGTGGKYPNCIEATNVHDLAITGGGTIDGQGSFWWKAFLKKTLPDGTKLGHRPFMIVIANGQRVLVKDVHLENSPMFHLVPRNCNDVTIQNVTITAPSEGKTAPNTDGIDPSGKNILITGCTIDTGDDCVAVKPTIDAKSGEPGVQNVFVTHCHFQHGHGMSVGGQTPGGLENMLVDDCTFDGTISGIRLKAAPGEGGLVEYLTYQNLTMHDVQNPIYITSNYGETTKKTTDDEGDEPVKKTASGKIPIWTKILIRNVTADGAKNCGQIIALPEQPATDITLDNVHVSGHLGLTLTHVRTMTITDSTFTAAHGPSLIATDAQVNGQMH